MLVAKKICAIVIVLNTRCYRMLAVLDDHRDYYNFHNWDHVKYAESPGCSGIRAGNGQELRHAADLALAIDIPLCCCSDA